VGTCLKMTSFCFFEEILCFRVKVAVRVAVGWRLGWRLGWGLGLELAEIRHVFGQAFNRENAPGPIQKLKYLFKEIIFKHCNLGRWQKNF